MRTLILAAVVVSVSLAGCMTGNNENDGSDRAGPDPSGTTDEPLYSDGTNAPHPAYGWPTLTHVPADTPDLWQPIEPRALPASIKGIEHIARATDPNGFVGGMAVFGSMAVTTAWDFGGTRTEDLSGTVLDISNPTAPAVLGRLEGGYATRGVDLVAYPDGSLVAVFATDSAITPLWDITDPATPQEIAFLEPAGGSHNVAVVPGTPILYNANADGAEASGVYAAITGGSPTSTGSTEIYDLTDPTDPVLVQEFENGFGCHQVTFFIDPVTEKYRAYCAGIDATQIWDITDPLAPEVIVTMGYPHHQTDLPGIGTVPMNSHLAMVNDDASILLIGDEAFGGTTPGCDDVRTPAEHVTAPLGNMYFLDISDETSPQLLGSIGRDAPLPEGNEVGDGAKLPGCTAHFGSIVPSEDRELVAMAWMTGGVVLIDFTDAANPEIVDMLYQGGTAWDARYYNGYIFTGDTERGMDVLGLA